MTSARALRQLLPLQGNIVGVAMVTAALACWLLSSKYEKRILLRRPAPNATVPRIALRRIRAPASDYVIAHDFAVSVDGLELIDCVRLKTEPQFDICVYPPSVDVFISRALLRSGSWEPEISDSIVTSLRENPGAGFLDIGANIGAHSLRAAALGRPVVMLEPLAANVKRLHKSVLRNNMTSRVRLLENAVCDMRSRRTLHVTLGNLGGNTLDRKLTPGEMRNETVTCIVMNDVTPLLPFRSAVMKIDVEGFEHRALSHAEELLERVDICAIYMEWLNMKRVLRDASRPDDAVLIQNMLQMLSRHSYTPSSLQHETLDAARALDWPNDVVWRKRREQPRD